MTLILKGTGGASGTGCECDCGEDPCEEKTPPKPITPGPNGYGFGECREDSWNLAADPFGFSEWAGCTFALLTGPSWLSLSSAGILSGTAPEGSASASFSFTVTNACGTTTISGWQVNPTDVGECLCSLTLDTEGGDFGYDHTFDVTGDFVSNRDIYPVWEFYTIKDRLLIDANGVNVYDTGCTNGAGSTTVTIPAGTTSVRVRIIPNCEGTTGTLWTLSITCAAI